MTWKPGYCLYHGNCDDGFGAAYAVWKRWGDDVVYLPCIHGDPPPELPRQSSILMVDFSYKRETIKLLSALHKRIVILDHHKTAEEELAPFCSPGMTGFTPQGVYYYKDSVVALFNMNKSGARLAWEFAHYDEPIPYMLELIEDRDLWRFAFDETKAFSASLRTYPMIFTVWDAISNNVVDHIKEGKNILRCHNANVGRFIKETYFALIGGHLVPVVNVPYHYASDAASMLLEHHKDAAFAVAWFRRADGKFQFSLRSEDSRADVSEIAKKYGGGGHRNAAGFQVEGGLLPSKII
jgi:uncharacterized protein